MSTKAKHAPGPWRWDVTDRYVFMILDSDDEIVAMDIDAITPANRALIGAAPEMLEALKVMTQWNVEHAQERSSKDSLPTEIQDALAAIAKAEGTAQP